MRFSLSLSLTGLLCARRRRRLAPSRATPKRETNSLSRDAHVRSCRRGCGARTTTSTSLPDRWIKLGGAVPVYVRTPHFSAALSHHQPCARTVDRRSRSNPAVPPLSSSACPPSPFDVDGTTATTAAMRSVAQRRHPSGLRARVREPRFVYVVCVPLKLPSRASPPTPTSTIENEDNATSGEVEGGCRVGVCATGDGRFSDPMACADSWQAKLAG